MASFIEGEVGGQPQQQPSRPFRPTTNGGMMVTTKQKRFRDVVLKKKTLGCGTIMTQLVKLPAGTDVNEWIGKYVSYI